MGRIFDVEGPLFTGLGRMADLIWLNILFIVCSIPIFTIGASATALYYVTLKMVKNEECYITKSFFKSFKQNFKQSTAIWLIMFVVGAFILIDYLIMNGKIADISTMPEAFKKVILVVLLMVALVYAFTLRYVFPLLARFDNTVKNTIKNSMLISIRHLPLTAILVALPIIAGAVLYFFPGSFIFYLLIVLSLVAYISSFLFVKIFAEYMPKDDEVLEETEKVAESSENDGIESDFVESTENNAQEVSTSDEVDDIMR